MSDTVFCNLCSPPQRMPAEELWRHLDRVHDERPEIETWPDGEVVIHDTTLEPHDFASGSPAADTLPCPSCGDPARVIGRDPHHDMPILRCEKCCAFQPETET